MRILKVMIQQRKDARKAKNFAEGDRIRNELKDRGITLIDQKMVQQFGIAVEI
jgi:cysteinyl-tRNA synthetase